MWALRWTPAPRLRKWLTTRIQMQIRNSSCEHAYKRYFRLITRRVTDMYVCHHFFSRLVGNPKQSLTWLNHKISYNRPRKAANSQTNVWLLWLQILLESVNELIAVAPHTILALFLVARTAHAHYSRLPISFKQTAVPAARHITSHSLCLSQNIFSLARTYCASGV